jgi:hypothetical protein
MKGFEHFVERSMTREKLKAIVLEHPAVMGRMRARYGMLEQAYCDIGSAKDAYAALKEARRDQMARRYGWRMAFDELRPEDKQYVAFVGAALDYNEDNRLLRSASFYRIMHDKTFPRRFHALIQGRKHGTK